MPLGGIWCDLANPVERPLWHTLPWSEGGEDDDDDGDGNGDDDNNQQYQWYIELIVLYDQKVVVMKCQYIDYGYVLLVYWWSMLT